MGQDCDVPAFDVKRLRLERFNVEWNYHAAYNFFGLKGALAERWAHGPIFGALGEVGSGQINLTPHSDDTDAERLVGVAGLRASALFGEGKGRAAQAIELWPTWFSDIQAALKPLRSVRLVCEILGLYPVMDEWRVTQRVKQRFYQGQALDQLAHAAAYHAGPEIFETDGRMRRTIQMGVLGPPHKGAYFAFPDKERDERWWLAFRMTYAVVDEEGIKDPLGELSELVESTLGDWARVGRTVFPDLVS